MNGIEGEEMAEIAKDGNLHVVNFTTYGVRIYVKNKQEKR